MKMLPRKKMAGMTLLELTVVLAILAIVTSIAVASFTAVEDQSRFESTARQFDQVEFAVLGDKTLRTPDNQPQLNGFVADIGRLPLLSSTLQPTLQPEELWINPNGLAPYMLRAATYNATPAVSNISSAYKWNGTLFAVESDASGYADPEVFLATGWRGDYLRLSPGATGLADGWGNSIGYFQSDLTTPAAASEELAVLRTLGSNNAVGGSSLQEADRDLRFRTTTDNRALGSLNISFDSSITAVTQVRAYSADPTTGKIRVYVYEVSSPTMAPFAGIPIGPKVVRAYNGTTAVSRPTSVTLTGVVPMTLRP